MSTFDILHHVALDKTIDLTDADRLRILEAADLSAWAEEQTRLIEDLRDTARGEECSFSPREAWGKTIRKEIMCGQNCCKPTIAFELDGGARVDHTYSLGEYDRIQVGQHYTLIHEHPNYWKLIPARITSLAVAVWMWIMVIVSKAFE